MSGRTIAALALRIAAMCAAACCAPVVAAAADVPTSQAGAAAAATTAYTFTVAPFEPTFTAPAPGTYTLPPIDDIADHELVDANGSRTTLARVLGSRLAVVSFIYGACNEVTGCPLSNAVLQRVDRRVSSDPAVARDVALVTVSFDPASDTPGRLAAMQSMRAAGSSWQFVTASDDASLDSLLRDFGQTVTRLRNPDGTPSNVFRHVLKVYLLDRKRRVRNIYSVGMLQPDLVWNDVLTLRLEGRK